MMMNRRSVVAAMAVGAAATLISTRGMAANPVPMKARNVVLVHGLFADGSCRSEVIQRLQAVGLTADAAKSDCGHACHMAVKAKDYIFHPYQKR